MKKLSLLFLMMLAVAFVMAQTQNNVALTEQDGDKNDALVKQIGAKNDGTIHQYGTKNLGTVKQDGNNNVGVADQLRGNNNIATVDQVGGSNKGYVQQGLTKDYYDDYTGSANPPTYNMYANNNDASVVQTGNSNFSNVGQWGNNNEATSVQDGNSNDVYIYQGWEGSWWNGPKLYATNSKVDIEQHKNGNSARVWQYGGNNNKINILQNGNDNLVSITQGWIYTDLNYDFTAPVLNTKNNNVLIDQIGNSNKAKMMQLGDNNLFKLTQTGNDNSLGYFAGSLQPSRNAYFTQDGDKNIVAGVHKNPSDKLSFWENHDAEQFNGATLSYESYQAGDLNVIGLRQGKDDFAIIQQDGIGNEALLWQQGSNQNVATMMQFGNNNSASIVQIQ